jgi:hypothetical protein
VIKCDSIKQGGGRALFRKKKLAMEIVTQLWNVAQSEYLGTVVTYQNYIHEENKEVKLGEFLCRALCSHPLSELLKDQNVSLVILPALLCNYGIWQLMIREGHRSNIFKNRILSGSQTEVLGAFLNQRCVLHIHPSHHSWLHHTDANDVASNYASFSIHLSRHLFYFHPQFPAWRPETRRKWS